MQINTSRFKLAFKAMAIHFGLSLLVAAIVALLVFTLWFPYPYRELAGGRELFILVMSVDIICGPLLTFVLFSPTKPKKEILTDISLIVVIQLLALCYGIWNVWTVRPIYLVQEADRFNIISRATIDTRMLDSLPAELKPQLFGEPIKVSLIDISASDKEKLISEMKAGGKDASERPSFYTKYDGVKAYQNAHPLRNLLRTKSDQKTAISDLVATTTSKDLDQLRFVYIVGRKFWAAVLNSSGEVIGYIEIQ
jgi:hypothetical protein